jgi:opacity protein-like surface antigen
MYARAFARPLIVATALSLGGFAWAADVYVPDVYVPSNEAYPQPAQAFSWTGIHLGVGGGIQFDGADGYASVYDSSDNFFDETSGHLTGTAWFATLDAGVDFQVQSFVVGLLANYDWHPSPATDQISSTDVDLNVTWGDSWAVGARAGWLFSPSTLFYVSGGYAQKNITAYSEHDVDGGSGYTGPLTAGGWQPGWFAGIGIETLLSQHVSAKLEYRYGVYSGFSTEDFCTGSICDFGDHRTIDVGPTTSQTIRAVLSWRL